MEIKRLLIIWLIICVAPLWAVAEEPVKAPAGEGIISERVSESSRTDFAESRFDLALLEERQEASYESSLPEWVEEMGRLSDQELGLISGQALVADSLDSLAPTDSRIILWDEVSTKAGRVVNQGGGQSITTISK